jgi:glucose-6-phosphate 1-dehydrogenase
LIEKPFGYDLESAKELKDIIGDFSEKVFLADHYLFKEEVGKMKGNFGKIKFVFLEKVGLEGRSYYDEIGAIRDMVQSHFLNLLFRIRKDLRHDLRLFSVEKFSRMQYDEYENELGKKSNTETFVDLVLKSGKNEFEFVTGKAFGKKQSCVFIDGKIIDFNERVNPYIKMFEEFFKSNREVFPKVEDAIFSWELIKWVLKHKSVLGFYPKGKDFVCENI